MIQRACSSIAEPGFGQFLSCRLKLLYTRLAYAWGITLVSVLILKIIFVVVFFNSGNG